MEQRADFGSQADDYFEAIDARLKPLALELRSLVRETIPNASEVIKWGMPVYLLHGKMWFCSIRAGKDYVALQFGEIGTRLDDPDGLLEGTGKNLRHVKIRSKDEIRRELFAAWIRQAAEANREDSSRTG